MNKYDGTIDQELTELSTLLQRPRADVSCSLTRWQHFSARNDVIAAILKVERIFMTFMRSNIQSPTLLIRCCYFQRVHL